MIHTIKYRNIPENARIDVRVEKLMDAWHYRVTIYEEYDAHIIELTDINICHFDDRRWLENYVKQFKTKSVFFGSMCLGRFYYLERYKEFVGDKRILNALNDLKLIA